ncbi:MAG: hypothetical protein DI538_26295 [Azospira oryzae]|jgi:uncharacterized tellurite resistance protein B-like protein|nr:hypothetical protein [Cytophaga sp.]PZR26639.1 MAG: hypothetical protein DI538_26295 [Azospira oryzae]
MVIHKSFADFVLFLYIHMAHADSDFHATEQQVILKKMTRLFPEEPEMEKKLEKANEEYELLSPERIPGVIRETFALYKDVKFAQKYKVYTDMYDIINADGKIDESETEALNELKEIIEMGTAQKSNGQ